MACATEENVQEYKYVRLGVLILTVLLPGCVLRTAFQCQIRQFQVDAFPVGIWLVVTTMNPTGNQCSATTLCWESYARSASSGTSMSPPAQTTRRRSALRAISRSHSLVVWRHPRLCIVTRLGDDVEAVRICGYAVTRTHAVGGRAPMTLLYVTATLSVCPIVKVHRPTRTA